MFLKRVQVPDFRALKNVDISFEQQLTPHVFPLGSQNGGGKSTLLQLIFALLHCSANSKRHDCIRNLLFEFISSHDNPQKWLATIHVVIRNNQVYKLKYLCCSDSFLRILASKDSETVSLEEVELSFLTFDKINQLERDFKYAKRRLSIARNFLNELVNIDNLKVSESEKKQHIVDLLDREEIYLEYVETLSIGLSKSEFNRRRQLSIFPREPDFDAPYNEIPYDEMPYDEILSQVTKNIEDLKCSLEEAHFNWNKTSISCKRIKAILEKNSLHHILNYSTGSQDEYSNTLVCLCESESDIPVERVLNEIAEKVFLAMPSSQVCLFAAAETRKSLFKTGSEKSRYFSQIELCKRACPNVFMYDFLNLDLLIDSFRNARDSDFREAVETGKYGSHYQQLIKSLNSAFNGKTLNVESDLSGVKFSMIHDNSVTDIYPEDLSHGELKKLMIYMWLLHNKVENSIVLMDEIELALHPDWQQQIVRDLVDWGPTNQYILATHSYSLCEAVTPAHVKEISPHFLSSSSSK